MKQPQFNQQVESTR